MTDIFVVKFKTGDGIEVVGDYYPADSKQATLLLHMMPADRKSWIVFAKKLQQAGFQALAIDFRGHGESQGGPDGYKKFSDEEHQSSRLDVVAGVEFLKSKKAEKIYLVGASIGANLALESLVDHPEIDAAVLLSPGIDYRGIKTKPLIERLGSLQALFLAASEEDTESFAAVQKLSEKIDFNEDKKIKIFKGAGHGTTIFERNPLFMDEVTDWLKNLK